MLQHQSMFYQVLKAPWARFQLGIGVNNHFPSLIPPQWRIWKKNLQLKFLFSTCRHCKNCPRKHSNLMETSSHFCPGPCSHTQPQVRRNQLCICTSEIPSVMTIRLVKVCGQSNNRISFAQQQKLPANTLMQQKPYFHIHRISGEKKKPQEGHFLHQCCFSYPEKALEIPLLLVHRYSRSRRYVHISRVGLCPHIL